MWVKLSDTFTDDPRVVAAGPEAGMFLVASLCYCGRQLTDGFISTKAARILWPVDDPGAAIDALVANGLWKAHPDGWEIVDYLVTQLSADEVRVRQAQAKVRWESFKNRRSQRVGNSVDNGVANASPSTKGRGAAGDSASLRRPTAQRRKCQRLDAFIGPAIIDAHREYCLDCEAWNPTGVAGDA